MARLLFPLLLAGVSVVTEVQAPHHWTAYDYIDGQVRQCVEDLECGTDTECVEVEDRCLREIMGGDR